MACPGRHLAALQGERELPDERGDFSGSGCRCIRQCMRSCVYLRENAIPHSMMPAVPPDETSRQRKELVGWFVRRDGPHWTPEDEQAFWQWLSVPANQAAYARWEADWRLMDTLPQASAARLHALVAADRRAGQAMPKPVHSPGRRRILAGGFAVAGVAAMATAGGWLGWQHIQALPVYEQAFSTRKGQQSEVTLPDGSTLRLDTATALKTTFFRNRREIRLAEGQAMFAVASDAQRPFQVTAGTVRITVVGTRFSVRLTPGIPGREGVEVAVEAGRVRVARAQEALDFELTAGQRLVFDADGLRPMLGTVPADGVAPWRGMPLSFSDVPLGQAVAEMARYGDLGIAAIDPAAAQLRLSGTFDPRNAAAARRLLVGALPVKLEQGAAGLELRLARR